MGKRRRKGRISDNLVAASCAAVLTVYAAGYWRTRDASRQFATQAKGRRPAVRTPQAAANDPAPALIEPSSPASQPRIEAPVTVAAAVASAQRQSSPVSARRATRAPAHTAALPASAAAGIVVAPIPMPPEPTPAVPPETATAAIPAARWRDGTYSGHGDSPHGDIDVRVVIKEGRIVEATIEACNTRYRCELIDPMIHQTVLVQSSHVDYVSRATESSDAYLEGLDEALNAALDQPPGKEAGSR